MTTRFAAFLLALPMIICAAPRVAAQTATITGRVSDAATGAALAGVQLVLADSTGNGERSVSTGTDGVYTLTAVSPGTYYLSTTNTLTYANETWDGFACVTMCDRHLPLVVAAGALLTRDFALDRGAEITGTVRSAAGLALADVNVGLGDARGQFVTTTRSAADGTYRLRTVYYIAGGLAASTYRVSAGAAGFVGQQYGTPIPVGRSQVVSGIDFVLGPTGSIAGRVTDQATGAPLSFVPIFLGPPASSSSSPRVASTDQNGAFLISNLAPGSYRVAAGLSDPYAGQLFRGIDMNTCRSSGDANCADALLAGTPVVVTAGVSTGGIDFTLHRAGSISGRLTRAGQPSRGSVSIYAPDGIEVGFGSADTSGNYSVTGLPAGRYFAVGRSRPAAGSDSTGTDVLYASKPCPESHCAVVTGTPIVVVDGATTSGIDIESPAAGQIAGSVTNAAGAPIGGASVRVYFGDRVVTSTTTAADGSYQRIVDAGAYRVQVSATGFIGEWYDNVCVTCGGRGSSVTVVPAGTTANVDFQLLAAGGKISGHVTLAGTDNNRSRSGLFVQALRADGTSVATAGLSSAGDYEITGLQDGTYIIRAGSSPCCFAPHGGFPTGGDYAYALYNGASCDGASCPLNDATPVTVSAGATVTGIDLTLEPAATIEGAVFGGDRGGDIAGVRVFNVEGRAVGHVRFDLIAFNRYRITGLSAGRYFLTAPALPGYGTTLYKGLACVDCVPQTGTPVVVERGERRTNVDISLVPAGSIEGLVRDDAGGAALSGITIVAFTPGGVQAGTGVTGRTGAYQVRDLAPGRYYLATRNTAGYVDEVFDGIACGSCDPTRGRIIDVQGGVPATGIDFGLSRGAVVLGTVLDATGSGVGSAAVAFFSASGTQVATARTDDIGGYTVSAPAGTLYARVAAALGTGSRLYRDLPCPGGTCDPTQGTPIQASAGQTVSGIDFTTPACGLVQLSPTALPGATAGATFGVNVTASPSGSYAYTVQSGSLPPGLSLTQANGRISGAPTTAGRYTFTVAAAGPSGCGASRVYVIDTLASCTPALQSTSVGSATFDVMATGGVINVTLDTSCPSPVVFNAPWLRRNRDLGPGTLELAVDPNTGARRTGTVAIGNRVVTVNQGASGVSAPPFGSFDAPADGSVVTGSVAIGGWVLDDLRVATVSLYRSPAQAEGQVQVFLGNATLVPGARPDVEAQFSEYPYSNRAGWGYLLLTNMLPAQGNGVFTITAIAEDVEGNRIALGHRTIVANNAAATQPFGAIDTPQQGETIAGASYVNFGWALTTKPKTIPKDGSTITVLIDGIVAGKATYNNPRQDIASLFPGLNNTSGPVGYRMLDTTALADGIHTIAWVVSDDGGAAEGIGSRYFTVANGASQFLSGLLTPPSLQAAPARGAAREIVARELELIEIDLANAEPASCRAVFSGVERVGADLRPLPIGSSLDRERGVFRWQPGPGFVGTYHLAFDVGQCDGAIARVDVDVKIGTKQ